MTARDAMSGSPIPPGQQTLDNDVEPPADAYDASEEGPVPVTNPEVEQPGWLAILQADTPADQVHKRAAMNRAGQPVLVNGQPLMLDYVTARFVQDRLDAAVGPQNWQTLFDSLSSGAVRCGLGIRVEGEWVWKWDVGVPSNIEPDKGAHSDAFKRAGVQWGIARDLYDDRDEKALMSDPSQQPVAAAAPPPPGIQYAQDAPPQPVMPQGAQPHPYTGQAQGVAAWVCPIHNDVRLVPPGISKKTQRPYRGFYACPVPGCDETGPTV